MKGNRKVLVSGYGPGSNNRESMALYTISDKMEIENELWSDTVEAPSFLCTYQDMCFTIREDARNGSVLCYKREEKQYVLQDELFIEGGALCHIVYQPVNQTLYCSFYETGHIAAIKVEQYMFTKVLNFFQVQPEEGASLTRIHCCALEPDGHRVFATNIALDRFYIFDTKEGELIPNPTCEYVQLEKGCGPRHLKFHPLQNYLYIITEYSNEIYTYLYEAQEEQPKLKLLQKISTLPEDFKAGNGESYGSSIDISKDGRFLYAANRGADTIAVYDIHADGTLLKIQDVSCGGSYPRHIALMKDDSCLMIANQKSDEVVFLPVDETHGTLAEVVATLPFYQPSYMEEI